MPPTLIMCAWCCNSTPIPHDIPVASRTVVTVTITTATTTTIRIYRSTPPPPCHTNPPPWPICHHPYGSIYPPIYTFKIPCYKYYRRTRPPPHVPIIKDDCHWSLHSVKASADRGFSSPIIDMVLVLPHQIIIIKMGAFNNYYWPIPTVSCVVILSPPCIPCKSPRKRRPWFVPHHHFHHHHHHFHHDKIPTILPKTSSITPLPCSSRGTHKPNPLSFTWLAPGPTKSWSPPRPPPPRMQSAPPQCRLAMPIPLVGQPSQHGSSGRKNQQPPTNQPTNQ